MRIGLALWVVLTHLAEWGPLSSTGASGALQGLDGWGERLFQGHGETHPAVVAFIVLSGYCIHRNGARRDSWNPRRYAIKRLFRIMPVYAIGSLFGAALFVLAVRVNAGSTVLASGTGQISVQGLLVKLSTLTAILPVAHMRTNPFNGYEGNGPLYTVAAEVWLYALYAGAMTLLTRRWTTQPALLVGLTAMFVVGIVGMTVAPSLREWWFNGSLVGFLPLWWMGAMAVGRRPCVRAVAGGGIGWVLATLYLHQHGSLFVEELRLLAFGGLVATAILAIDGTRLRLRDRLASFARCGYSLYAFHAPALILLVALGAPPELIFLAAIATGTVMFRALEDPMTRLGRELTRAAPASRPLAAPPPSVAPAGTRR